MQSSQIKTRLPNFFQTFFQSNEKFSEILTKDPISSACLTQVIILIYYTAAPQRPGLARAPEGLADGLGRAVVQRSVWSVPETLKTAFWGMKTPQAGYHNRLEGKTL